ncbi:hypothetical protein F5883DRAFT_574049 [Diaporthe sp. PMI_573]|nr:hypothetical protein F5883DRAFT_574049 [Diaporthaceae sp. PMI_573]
MTSNSSPGTTSAATLDHDHAVLGSAAGGPEEPSDPGIRHSEPLPPSWVPLYEMPMGTPTRKLRIVTIGAGVSGIGFAYNIRHMHRLSDGDPEALTEHTIYEANNDVGGTWLANEYPGIACDAPAHAYTFAFEPNPRWSSFYASGPEIQDYIKRTVAKYDLDRDLKLQHRVEHAEFDETEAKWLLRVRRLQDNTVFDDTCDILISATGFLSRWRWPSIPGLQSFKGHLVHSAAWNAHGQFDYTGKRLGVIGNGSSAIQILPQLTPVAAQLVNFIRQPAWITPGFGSTAINDAANYTYSEEEKAEFAKHPDKLRQYRKYAEHGANAAFDLFVKDSLAQSEAKKVTAQKMHERLGGDEFLTKKLIPAFHTPIGCRRATPGPGYLESFTQNHVSVITEPIELITASGIRTSDGTEVKLDAIICATGFDVSYCPPWPIIGRNGTRLDEHWKDEPFAYLGLMTSRFPNLFMFAGPNSPIAHNSIMSCLQWSAEWMCKWIRKIAKEDIKFIEPRPEVVEELNTYADEIMRTLVWSHGTRSWYKNHRVNGRVTAVWAGSGISYYKMIKDLRPEDFEIVYRTKNRFRFMGNGRTRVEFTNDADLAFYMD